MENEDFKSRSKNGCEGAFTRERSLPFKSLIVIIAQMAKSGLQREMDKFFKELSNADFNIREITKSAFSKSRKKLKPEAFLELNDIVNNDFYDDAPYLGYNNHRLIGVDGSTLELPNHPATIKEFGQIGFGPNANVKKSMATISSLYDVANYLTLDVQIDSYESSEKDLLLRHLPKMKEGDLLLADRGYPGLAVFFLLKSKGIQFCIRMVENWWTQVREFKESDQQQTQIEITLPKIQQEQYREKYGELGEKMLCRLVKVQLDNGEIEIICTSLLDIEKYPIEDFKELYHLRWGIEEGYKMYKSRINIEAFTGKTPITIKQDIYAKVFLMSLCAAYAFPIEEKVKKEYLQDEQRKHCQKINRTNAVAFCRSMLIAIFIKNKAREAIKAFDDNIKQTREIVRPDRSFPRNHKKKRRYYMNYKDL
ncbi:MAG: IS4 family transposase [Sphingobacteriales bacterium]